MSAIQQRVGDLAHDVETLAPVQMAVVRIEGQVAQVKEQLIELREALVSDRDAAQRRGKEMAAEIKELRKDAQDNRDTQSADAKTQRRQIWWAAVTILVAVIGLCGTILTVVVGG